MSQKVGLVPTRMLDMIPNMASSFVGAKLTYVDDLVFNKLKAHLGVFSVSKYDGLVSPDYAVYYSTGKVHLKYLEYLFKTPQCISEFRKRSTGIAAGLTRLYTDGLFAIECPFPSMDDQVAIVEHLNTKCDQIDQLIAIKQKKPSSSPRRAATPNSTGKMPRATGCSSVSTMWQSASIWMPSANLSPRPNPRNGRSIPNTTVTKLRTSCTTAWRPSSPTRVCCMSSARH